MNSKQEDLPALVLAEDSLRVEKAQMLQCALNNFSKSIFEREFHRGLSESLRSRRQHGKCCLYEEDDFACSDGCARCRLHFWSLTAIKWQNVCHDLAEDLDYKLNLDIQEKFGKSFLFLDYFLLNKQCLSLLN